MQSFSYLEGNVLYVSRPEGENPPHLIGVSKSKDNPELFRPTVLTAGEAKKLQNTRANFDDTIEQEVDLTQQINNVQNEEFQISINALRDWSIEDASTAALAIRRPSQEANISLIRSLSINSKEPKTLILEGYLACHRGNGKLIISVNQAGETQQHEINFKAEYKGGAKREGYEHFSIPINTVAKRLKIDIHIAHYGSAIADAEDCFYFIGDLTIKPKEILQPFCKPRINGKRPKKPNTQFYKVNVPKFTDQNDASLFLEWSDGTREEAFAPIKLSATFQENFNHTVKIYSNAPKKNLCLYINDKIAKTFRVKSKETFISIPNTFLTGEPAIASLTDESGSQILDQIVITPPRSLVSEETLIEEGKKSFPLDFSLRQAHRLESIKLNLINNAFTDKDNASLTAAIKNLELNYKTLKLDPLIFPDTRESIKASIIIPAHNKIETTYYCLCSLLLAVNKTNFEIIVVDDGSTDKTQELEDIVTGITVTHNKEPQRFIEACNKGVSISQGEYVVLLNNDTEVTSGWLDALIDGFQRFEQVGLVGSRLLYPDGRLQDAGGIIWKTGDPWNYGNGENPWDPRFSYSRQADYLSGAALMTTKKIWDEVGGLSDYLKPMYFEDTDFSFKVREAGYKTYFIPQSTIYHFEGVTSGTDTSQGFKRYQEVNRPKFKKRWSHAFSTNSPVGIQPDLEKDRNIVGRVLFIDYQLPRGDRDAGSYAALKEIKLFQSLGFKATFIPTNLGDLGEYKATLQKEGVEVITAPFYLSTDHFLERRGHEFDIIYVTRYTVLSSCLDSIKRNCGEAKIILCNADLHFLRELRSAARTSDQQLLEQAKQTQQQEFSIMKNADVVISYNDVEHSVIFSHSEGAIQPLLCPWVVEAPKRIVDPSVTRKGLSFLGSFKHPPNKEGIEWFIKSVFPFLDRDVTLNVYGSGMTEEDKEDLTADKVLIHGFITNLHDAFDYHNIFIAPLLSGAGIKGKVLSAAAHGIPTILSPVAAEGTGLRHGQECLIAETTDEWIEAVHRLLDDEALWDKISTSAQEFILNNYSFESGREKMIKILESINIYSYLP